MKIKRFAVLFIAFSLVVSLAFKTISTFTLCGGTLMQNWLGVGACTDQQTKFIGYGNPMMDGRESVGVVILIVLLVIAALTRFVYVGYFKK